MDIEQKRLMAKRKLAKQKAMSMSAPQAAPVEQPAAQTPVMQPEPQAEPPSNWAVAGESFTRELPSNLLGIPGDVVDFIGNTGRALYTGVTEGWDAPVQTAEQPLFGSDWMKENLFSEVADRDDYTTGQNLLGNVLSIGGEAAAGGVGLARQAPRLAKEGPEILKDVVEPYLTRPNAQVVQDAAGGAGAGAGLTVAEENDMGPIGTLFSMLLGGAGTTGMVKTAETRAPVVGRNAQARAESPVMPGATNRAVDDARSITDEIVTNRSDALENIDNTLKLTDETGLQEPTLGPASGDIGLSQLEVNQRVKNPKQFLEKDQAVRTSVADKFGEFRNPDADVTAPQRSASNIIDEEVGRAQSVVDDIAGQKDLTEQQLRDLEIEGEQIQAPIQARRGSEGRASAELDQQVKATLDEKTTVKNQKFEQSAEGAYVDANSLAKLIDDVNAEAPKLAPNARLPDYIMQGIRKFIPQPGTLEGPNSTAGMIPADEVLKLRRYLDTEIQSLKAKGDFTKADTLQNFKGKINQTIDADPTFKEANDFYKEEYAPFFRSPYGKQYRDNVQRGDGTGKSDAENIASFFLNKTSSAADDLKRITDAAPDPKAADDAVELYFDATLAKKGKLNPKVVRNFIADNMDVLPEALQRKYAGVVQDLMGNQKAQDNAVQKIRDLGRDIRKAEKDLSSTERALSSGPLGKMSRYDSDKYVADIMGSKDRMKQLNEVMSRFENDPDALEGFKEATVEWLQKKVTGTARSQIDTDVVDGPLQFAKLSRTFNDNREALAKVFDANEMSTLNQIHEIMSKQGNLARRATVGSDTAEKIAAAEQNVMNAIEAVLRVKFGMIKGGGLMATGKKIKGQLLGANGRMKDAEEVLQRMAFDPRVAKHVLEIDPMTVENGKWFSELRTLIAAREATSEE